MQQFYLLFFIFWSLSANFAKEVVVYNFQENGIASDNTYAIYEKPIEIDFRNSSLCFWFSVNYLRGADQTYGCMVTMSTRAQPNAISFCLLRDNGIIWIEVLFIMYGINVNKFNRGSNNFELRSVKLRKWHHLCSTYSFWSNDLRTDISLYIDGKNIANWSVKSEVASVDTKTEVLPVMGQDQDEFGGKFEAAQSFSGKLANLRVMNRTLKPNEVAERNPFVHKDYWTLFNDWKFSNVDLTFEVQENFQKENIFRNYLLTFINIDFYRSKEICDLAQGRLPLPETEEEFEKITEIFSSILKSNNVTGGLGYLLGYIFKPEKDNWFNVYTKKAVPKTHFLHGNKRLDKNCFLRWPPKNDFYPISCKQRTAAQFCKVDNGLELHLKGFCSEEENMRELLFDDWYYLFGIKNERPHFQGPGQSEVYFDSVTSQWKIESHVPPFTYLLMDNKGLSMSPLGRNTWKVVSDRDFVCGHATNKSIVLTLSKCFPNKFTCDNGACIPLSERCDTELNCIDGSDESNCNYVVFPNHYAKEIAPVEKLQSSLNIYMNVTILDIPYINTYEMKLAISFILCLRWQDFRLEYLNLNENHALNSLSKEDQDKLWKPNIVITNMLGQSGIVYDERTLSKLIGQSEPVMETKDLSNEAKIFPGKGNYIFMIQKLYEEFTCQFSLENYPFDTQACKMTFDLVSGSQQRHLLIDGIGVMLARNKYLVEHQIIKIWARQVENRTDLAEVTVVLRRRMEHHLFNTFLQIVILLLIGILSLYFNIDNFSERIMVTLTTLLLLVTIISSIQGDLPKTNYFKLIDVWLLFSVDFLSFIMVFHTHISGLERPKTSNSMVGVMFPVEQEDNNKQLYIKIHKRNRQGKIFFSLLFITFFIGFSSRAMHVYYNAAVNEDNI